MRIHGSKLRLEMKVCSTGQVGNVAVGRRARIKDLYGLYREQEALPALRLRKIHNL